LTSANIIWAKAVKPVVDSAKSIVHLRDSVAFISAQLAPNGGASLRDTIDRVEKHVRLIDARAAIIDARHKMLLNQEQFVYFEADSRGGITLITRVAMRWTGRPTEDLCGAGWLNMVWPADHALLAEKWEQSVMERGILECRHGITDPAGQRLAVFTRAWPVIHIGEVVSWIGTIHREGVSQG
jgi:PAS domain-containing protein